MKTASVPEPSWQRRALYAFGAVMVAVDMIVTATMVAWEPHSSTFIAAELTGVRNWMPPLFLLCALGMVPFMLAQARPAQAPHWTCQLLCASCFLAALLWIGTDFAARHANLSALRLMCLMQAACAIALMFLVAAGYNALRRTQCGLDGMHAGKSNRVPLAKS